MLAKRTFRPLRPIGILLMLYVASIALRSQEQGGASMTPFYIVTIVFTVLVVAAVISFFVSNKKKN